MDNDKRSVWKFWLEKLIFFCVFFFNLVFLVRISVQKIHIFLRRCEIFLTKEPWEQNDKCWEKGLN